MGIWGGGGGGLSFHASSWHEKARDDFIGWSQRARAAEDDAPAVNIGALPATRVVTVCDREGDIWDLLHRQHELADQVGVLVRSNGARQHQVVLDDGRTVPLQAHMEALDPVGHKEVTIEAQGGKRVRAGRTARVAMCISGSRKKRRRRPRIACP